MGLFALAAIKTRAHVSTCVGECQSQCVCIGIEGEIKCRYRGIGEREKKTERQKALILCYSVMLETLAITETLVKI